MSRKAAFWWTGVVAAIAIALLSPQWGGGIVRTVHDTTTVDATSSLQILYDSILVAKLYTADSIINANLHKPLTAVDSIVRITCPSGAGPSKVIHYPARLWWTWYDDHTIAIGIRGDSITLYQRQLDPQCSVSRGSL